MPFVKLDTGIMDSSLWWNRDARDLFITALLMAVPYEVTEPMPQLEVRALKETGFVVQPGWYGFVKAAGSGLIRRACVEEENGLDALEQLGSPESESRSQEYDGRRLVRVNGGYIILNFMKYRDKDHTAADRQRKLRERRKKQQQSPEPSDVTGSDEPEASRDSNVTGRNGSVTSHIAESREQKQKADAIPLEPPYPPREVAPPTPPPIKSARAQAPGGGGRRDRFGKPPSTEEGKWVARLFNRKETTLWTKVEVKAFLQIRSEIEDPETRSMIERYYTAERSKGDDGIHRRDLPTFLNNFPGELDRARAWAGRQGSDPDKKFDNGF